MNSTSPSFSAQQKIEILFKEYDTLRTEIICRTNNFYTLTGAAATVLIAASSWVITSDKAQNHLFALSIPLAIVTGAFALLFWVLNQNVHRCGYRLEQIERMINVLAGHAESPLLEWETRWGGRLLGMFPNRAPHSYFGDQLKRASSDQPSD